MCIIYFSLRSGIDFGTYGTISRDSIALNVTQTSVDVVSKIVLTKLFAFIVYWEQFKGEETICQEAKHDVCDTTHVCNGQSADVSSYFHLPNGAFWLFFVIGKFARIRRPVMMLQL